MSPVARVCREVADDAWNIIGSIDEFIMGEKNQLTEKYIRIFKLRFTALLYFLASCYFVEKHIERDSSLFDTGKDPDELKLPVDFYVKNTSSFHLIYETIKLNEKISIFWFAISPDFNICTNSQAIDEVLDESVSNFFSKIQSVVVDVSKERYSSVDLFYNLQSITFENYRGKPDIFESDTQFELLGKRIACDYYYDLVDYMRMWIHKEDDYYNDYYCPKDGQNPWEQLKDDIEHGEPPYCEPYFMYVCLNRLEKLDDNIQYLIWVLVGENQIYRENNPYDCDLKTLDEEIAMQIFKQFYSEAEKELAKEG